MKNKKTIAIGILLIIIGLIAVIFGPASRTYETVAGPKVNLFYMFIPIGIALIYFSYRKN